MNTLQIRTFLLAIIGGLASCTGAENDKAMPHNVDKSSQSAKSRTSLQSPAKKRTTSPAIAIGNMNAQIVAMQKRVDAIPSDISSRKKLVDLLLNRTKFLGSYDDFDRALAIASDAQEKGCAPAPSALLHAKVLSALHRFDAALTKIAVAESLGAKGCESARQSIELARGNSADAIASERLSLAARAPSYASLTAAASAYSSANEFGEADQFYVKAQQQYRDVSPFPLAWISFQRGMMWGERADDSDKAYTLYQDAVARLPQYIVANVHLAELENARGETKQAIARLERIIDTTVDPEPASRLAEMLRDSDPSRADAYAKRAALGYAALLKKYPLAFSDHATEFYLGEGKDPDRALELAMLNLSNRQTERAYELALSAAKAAGDTKLAAKLSAR